MADIVTPSQRSRMMAGIRSTNTKPEMQIRQALHARGLRFRLHDRRLAGTPDLVFAKFGAVIFVHGCFWHGHEGCPFFKKPATRPEFWLQKIGDNQARDVRSISVLMEKKWRVALVWECALREKNARPLNEIADEIVGWLRSDEPKMELRGRPKTD